MCLIYTPDGRCATTEGYLTSPWGNHRMNLTPNAAKDRQYRLGNLIRFNSSRNALKTYRPAPSTSKHRQYGERYPTRAVKAPNVKPISPSVTAPVTHLAPMLNPHTSTPTFPSTSKCPCTTSNRCSSSPPSQWPIKHESPLNTRNNNPRPPLSPNPSPRTVPRGVCPVIAGAVSGGGTRCAASASSPGSR